MNPLLILLIFIGAFMLWVLLACLYPIVGRLTKGLWDDVKHNMKKNR